MEFYLGRNLGWEVMLQNQDGRLPFIAILFEDVEDVTPGEAGVVGIRHTKNTGH